MATTEEKLAEAQQAYHDLVTGNKARVIVDQNGERVEFVTTNKAQLYQYIVSLQTQVASPAPNTGPMGFLF
jgi:hypothetical protein